MPLNRKCVKCKKFKYTTNPEIPFICEECLKKYGRIALTNKFGYVVAVIFMIIGALIAYFLTR